MHESVRNGVRSFVTVAGAGRAMTFGAVAVTIAFESSTRLVAGAWTDPVLLFFPILVAMGGVRAWFARSRAATLAGLAALMLGAGDLLALSAGWIPRSPRSEAVLWVGLSIGMGRWFWRNFERARQAESAARRGGE